MDKNIPFPECAKNCEVVKMLGVGECESVCEHKFDTSGRQLTIPAVMKSVCGCDKPKPMARNLDEAITCITCRKVIEQTVLQRFACIRSGGLELRNFQQTQNFDRITKLNINREPAIFYTRC